MHGNNKKVCIAMSGGVDSSVAAALLQDDGFECIGITMDTGIQSNQIIGDTKKIADKLGIEHHIVEAKKYFEDEVIKYFVCEYLGGRTPNPCVVCNYRLKFGLLLDKAVELGADYIATGHYAKLCYSDNYNRFLVKKAVDAAKDQTYFLYNMSQYQIARTLMPLADYKKEEVKMLAIKKRLFKTVKSESQEICFIPSGNYRKFLTQYIQKNIDQEGNFVDLEGRILGKHSGIYNYTIGQRKKLGIALGKKVYVINIIPERNEVVLGSKDELLRQELISVENNFILFEKLEENIPVEAKIRYNASLAKAVIKPIEDNKIHVVFDEPQSAVTPGQSVVFYKNDILLGGGIIERTY